MESLTKDITLFWEHNSFLMFFTITIFSWKKIHKPFGVEWFSFMVYQIL